MVCGKSWYRGQVAQRLAADEKNPTRANAPARLIKSSSSALRAQMAFTSVSVRCHRRGCGTQAITFFTGRVIRRNTALRSLSAESPATRVTAADRRVWPFPNASACAWPVGIIWVAPDLARDGAVHRQIHQINPLVVAHGRQLARVFRMSEFCRIKRSQRGRPGRISGTFPEIPFDAGGFRYIILSRCVNMSLATIANIA